MSSEMEVNNEFGGETGQSDLTLVVEDHKIPVLKAVLCIASPVFRAMLESDFQEKSKREIPLPGKSYEDFVEFLKCIYPDKMKKITEKNAYKLLPLAHEYEVKKMEKRCQKVLIQAVRNSHMKNVMELYRHIHMSETYRLEELKKICIYLASEHNLEQFKVARQTYQISDASHYMIIELALRRHELDKQDEGCLSLKTEDGKEQRGFLRYDDIVKFSLTGKVNLNESDTARTLRALRLSERFKITTNETDVKSRMIRKLQNDSTKTPDNDPHKEEFDLLPERIKIALKNK
ncbi:BTB and MATH domain-containing protein 38-like [Mercenaria mercenaria]|uniref:BTB and MATH domain-containing protein 38-like n=1 Tax=Mercenaria mercenaria TaxID=6596 RepID=UPI00234E7ABC|nr:BTB and MATH domain-containing protein 38-like [Mercenaria mercenaria]